MSDQPNKENVERAKKSIAYGFDANVTSKDLYESVAKGVAGNVKMGPFKATSGVVLPYYLNLSTNFLDKKIAGPIIRIMTDYLEKVVKPKLPKKAQNKPILGVGMEVAGGMLATQFATNELSPLCYWMDFVYMRKERKTSGTLQQLEGPKEFTSRTKDSPVLYAVWLDDCLSTGGSLVTGIKTLKKDYNIEVVGAFFLVDRSKDRQKLPVERQWASCDMFNDFEFGAVYDLKEIHDLVPKK